MYVLGNQGFQELQDRFIIGGVEYTKTKGLHNLIWAKEPRGYTHKDRAIYKQILLQTNAYRRGGKPQGQIQGTGMYKYTDIIKPLVKPQKRKSVSFSLGSGVIECGKQQNPPQIVRWTDPNELCERLRLLTASKAAGHTGLDVEIQAIVNELRNANVIE